MKNIKTWTSQQDTLAKVIQDLIDDGKSIVTVVPIEYRDFSNPAIKDLSKALIIFN